jgi:hypothetical protein
MTIHFGFSMVKVVQIYNTPSGRKPIQIVKMIVDKLYVCTSRYFDWWPASYMKVEERVGQCTLRWH